MKKESIPRFGTINFERRKHPRLSVDLPVEYWHINNPGRHPGRTAVIGEGGVSLYLSEEIEIGQNLSLKLFVDSTPKLKTIVAKVQAVWKDFRLGKEDYCRLGVKFVDISPEAIEELRNFLITLMNPKISSDFKLPLSLLSARGISILSGCVYLKPNSP